MDKVKDMSRGETWRIEFATNAITRCGSSHPYGSFVGVNGDVYYGPTFQSVKREAIQRYKDELDEVGDKLQDMRHARKSHYE